MGLNAATIEQQVLDAVKAAAAGAAPGKAAELQQLAKDMAAAMVAIATDRAAGTLTDAQAKGLIQATVDGGEAALLGLAAPAVQAILSAGLKVLINVAATSAGVGWAVPIIRRP